LPCLTICHSDPGGNPESQAWGYQLGVDSVFRSAGPLAGTASAGTNHPAGFRDWHSPALFEFYFSRSGSSFLGHWLVVGILGPVCFSSILGLFPGRFGVYTAGKGGKSYRSQLREWVHRLFASSRFVHLMPLPRVAGDKAGASDRWGDTAPALGRLVASRPAEGRPDPCSELPGKSEIAPIEC